MRLLSWNVNGRVQDAAVRQVREALSREPDVIALQEVTLGSYADWCDALAGSGYSVVSGICLVALPYPPPPYASPPFPAEPPERQIRRKYFNLVASRHPIATLPGLAFEDPEEARFAYPEKHVAARVLVDDVAIDVHNTHLPPGVSRGALKVHAFEAIRQRLDQPTSAARILCGDFNAPLAENADGPLPTVRRGTLQPLDVRWDAAEASVVDHPGLVNAYRATHPETTTFPASHHTGPRRTPRRYDRVYASAGLRAIGCEYLVESLKKGLSDHAAVEATFAGAS